MNQIHSLIKIQEKWCQMCLRQSVQPLILIFASFSVEEILFRSSFKISYAKSSDPKSIRFFFYLIMTWTNISIYKMYQTNNRNISYISALKYCLRTCSVNFLENPFSFSKDSTNKLILKMCSRLNS